MVRAEAGRGDRIAVIDIGSNSLRLVVYDGLCRAPLALYNEKVLCGLARGLATTGRLDPAGVELALVHLQRFVGLARAIGVARLDAIATAAVRDAIDGPAFAARIAANCGMSPTILSGAAEARLSAFGVLSGIPQADGIMCDLGGGSAELVALEGGGAGSGVTLPIGPLRLAHLARDEASLRAAVDEPLARLGWLAQGRGRDLYLVGGACRTLARIHMEHAGYPLHIIQHYVIGRGDAAAFLDLLFHLSRTSLERIAALPRKRLDAVPLAAFVLARLVRAIAPRRIVFSAFGLREGHLYDLCPAADRGQDPLLAASAATAAANRRFGIEASELERWTAPLFPEEDARRRRLRSAAALLGDVHWAEHPDYRAEQAFLKTLRMPVGGLDHGERVFLATVLHARYGGAGDAWILAATRRLLQEDDAATARALGIALRLAYTLTGGAPGLLRQTSVALDSGTVTVTAADNGIFSGDAVQRRLEALGKAFGRRAVLMAAAATRRGESACPPR